MQYGSNLLDIYEYHIKYPFKETILVNDDDDYLVMRFER